MNAGTPISVLLLGAVLWAGVAVAGMQPAAVVTGIPHQALFSIAFDGASGVAVGAGGQILRSADAGASWEQDPPPTKLGLLGVTQRDGRSIAVGQMGLIVVREQGGAWTVVDSGSRDRLMAVAMNASGQALAVGAFGTILRSHDAGRSWERTSPAWADHFEQHGEALGDGFMPHLYGVSLDDDGRATVVGEVGLVLRSENAGRQWALAHMGDPTDEMGRAELFGLALRPDGLGYAVGQRGIVMRTDDGGRRWQRVDVGSTANLLGVSLTEDGGVTIAAMREIIVSRDAGQSWQKVESFDVKTGWYGGTAVPEGAGRSFAVGHSGQIISLPN